MQLLNRLIAGQFSAGHKIFLLILLTAIEIHTINGQRSCYQCDGINCLRSTYNKVEKCTNGLDICATIFDGPTVQAQGCLENLAEDLRMKCDSDDIENMTECHKCNENLCNSLGSSLFECVECDSKKNPDCYDKAETLKPVRCPISRTVNQYCYAKKDGESVVRGCTSTLEHQTSCLASQECIICDPREISSCNTRSAREEEPAASPAPPTSPTSPTSDIPKPEESGSGTLSSFGTINYVVLIIACLVKFY